MFKINNDTRVYWNQYFDVMDLPETSKDERKRTCNVSCVAMITGESPNSVLKNMIKIYGEDNDKYQWEELLIEYLQDAGFDCKPLTKTAWPRPREILDEELKAMMLEIRNGGVIFYHKYGHYQIMTGFRQIGPLNLGFYFNDPAGDRKKPYYKRDRVSGHNVLYPYEMVKHEPIFGKCWGVRL